MRLHKLKASDTTGTYLVESPVTENDILLMAKQLASLREPVDAFFEAVLVNAEDTAVRANRYALLAKLRGLFLGVADISLLV